MGFHVALHNGGGKKSHKEREEREKSSDQPLARGLQGPWFLPRLGFNHCRPSVVDFAMTSSRSVLSLI
jgi:hypothetical protein